jgi:hypothetical protein
VETGREVPGSSIVVVAVAVHWPEETGRARKRGVIHARMPERAVALVVAGARLAGVVDVEGQWMPWDASAEDGILLAEVPAVVEVVDGLSEEETSALERQARLLGAGFDGKYYLRGSVG